MSLLLGSIPVLFYVHPSECCSAVADESFWLKFNRKYPFHPEFLPTGSTVTQILPLLSIPMKINSGYSHLQSLLLLS